jgi:hypothetical protein
MSAWLESATVRAAVVAGAAAVAVAVASAIRGWISASYQSASGAENLQATMLLELVRLHDAVDRAEFARRMIQAGIIKDPDGSICAVYVGKGCPLHVLKAN